MKMIDVLNKLAKGEIKEKTELFVYDHIECIDIYTFDGKAFYDEYDKEIGTNFIIDSKFLNYTVELIPPKEKKYLVKFNMRGLRNGRKYLNLDLDYDKRDERVHLNSKYETLSRQTEFTKQELQSIQPVREFLEDMEGKYELIEVEDDAVN
ncbi:hypothetical protein EB06_01182 [Enterococcus cecorum]|uniref:hypothetical protein n=1 Tax=Enterococcus cecorum TaxID=44008 RepID=UPI000DE85AF0|nr:hypothetical protein [Enterococcus cecorum]RBR32298.1 hypothetical protein EB06_01182 [Enterococcus cecorum]